jgi:hypothetical protein
MLHLGLKHSRRLQQLGVFADLKILVSFTTVLATVDQQFGTYELQRLTHSYTPTSCTETPIHSHSHTHTRIHYTYTYTQVSVGRLPSPTSSPHCRRWCST